MELWRFLLCAEKYMNSFALASKRSFVLSGVVVVVAIGLLSYGTWGLWQRYEATHNPSPTIPSGVVTYSTDQPDETPIDAECDEYTITADRPRKLTINTLSIDSCIQPVGVDQHGAIAVPTNIHLTGWFVESALPGVEGVSIIDGHVGGRYTDAVFKRLGELHPGDDISVELGDGTIKRFEVIDSNSYSVAETTQKMFDKAPGVSNQLTLITCGGTFDAATQSYDERVIIRAGLSEE